MPATSWTDACVLGLAAGACETGGVTLSLAATEAEALSARLVDGDGTTAGVFFEAPGWGRSVGRAASGDGVGPAWG